jgi:hypothetical protein
MKDEKWPLEALDKVLVFDPSWDEKKSASRRGLAVVALTPSNRPIVLETYASRLDIGEVIGKIAELYRRWQVRGLFVEVVGNQHYVVELIKKWMENKELRGEACWMSISELRTSTKLSKESRIRDVVQEWGSRAGIWHTSMCDTLLEEYPYFPIGRTMDVVDAVAYGLTVVNRPYSEEEEMEESVLEEELLAGISARTGY